MRSTSSGVSRRRVAGADFRALVEGDLGRQAVPQQLLGDRVGPVGRHVAPAVDGAGGTGRDAVVAKIALGRIDHVVARVMADRIDRAGLLAGVAADADLGVDQMLAQDGRWGGGHGFFLGFMGVPMVAEKAAGPSFRAGPRITSGAGAGIQLRTSGFRLSPE
jgi:hypothetical protein